MTEVRSRRLLILGDKLHAIRVDSNQIESYAFRINAGSLTRLEGEDWDFAAPADGSSVTALRNASHSKVWLGMHGPVGLFEGSGVQRIFYGYNVLADGSLSRSSADDMTLTGPNNIQGGGRNWQHGDYLYLHDTPQAASAHSRLYRIRISTGAPDPGYVGMGVRPNVSASSLMLGFNGRIFCGVDWVDPISGAVPIGRGIEMRAVQVDQEFLEWDAPTSAYNILNSRRQANAGFRVAVMDPDVIGASVANAEFTPIPVDVRSVRQVTLNGTREDLGDGQEWRFDVGRQKLIQDPGATALTATDALVVDFLARAIAQACNPAAAVMRDDFADLQDSDGLAFDDALETAEAFLDRYGTLTDRLSVEIRDHAELAAEAETVQFDTAMLRALGLTDAADADRWLIYDVQLRWDGDIRIQRAECQRGEFRERSVDWWRERDDNA